VGVMNHDAPPAMPLYVNDWLTGQGVLMMSDAEQGLFLRLLCLAWKADPPCSIPADQKLVAKMLGKSPAQWRRVSGLILKKFQPIKGTDRIRNPKQWAVYSEIMARRERHSRNGLKGAESRWRGHDTDDGPANSPAIDSPLANACPSIEAVSETETDLLSDREKSKAFEDLWGRYPMKDGKRAAERHFGVSVKTPADLEAITAALDTYLYHLRRNVWKKPKNGSTWFNNWRDWVEWEEHTVAPNTVPNDAPDYGDAPDVPDPEPDLMLMRDWAAATAKFEVENPRPENGSELRVWKRRLWSERRVDYDTLCNWQQKARSV
jgi:uncharacterized protein YdaU (DUF1376 family)